MSYEGKSTTSDKIYYQIFDQKLRTRVPETHPDAIARINKKGVQVHERETFALFGTIENIELEDTDFGKQIRITLDKNDDGKNPVLSVGVESKNGRDLLKTLPSVDFSQEVRIMPYRFTPDDKDEEISGISISQKDEEGKFTVKVQNHFMDENKKPINGYPTIDWDKATEAEQKIYKIQRDAFLVDYLKEKVLPVFAEKSAPADGFEYPEEELGESPF